MDSFGARLAAGFALHSQLCVGIDPHPWLLAEWGLADSAAGVREFGLRVVDAAAGRAAVIKPQVAFFERFGAAGFASLEEVIARARSANLLVIADAKRGDIGSSVEAYAQAWLQPGSPLEADALTVSPFLGFGSLQAPLEMAEAHGKGLFVLAATSNTEAAELQQAQIAAGDSVAATITKEVVEWNGAHSGGKLGAGPPSSVTLGSVSPGSVPLGSVGLVLGATLDLDSYGIDVTTLATTPILAPGFGHQGAKLDSIRDRYGAAAGAVLVSVSRSILSAGPNGLEAAIDATTSELVSCLG